MEGLKISIIILLFGTFLTICMGLELQKLHGSNECEQFETDRSLNLTWVKSVSKWYVPTWSKSEYFLLLHGIFGEGKFYELTEKDAEESCLVFSSLENDNMSIYGFNGKKLIVQEAHLNPVRKGTIDYGIRGEYIGSAHIVLTDNQNYFVGLTKWARGNKGFFVASNKKHLSGNAIIDIYKKVTSLGFKARDFYNYDYEKC